MIDRSQDLADIERVALEWQHGWLKADAEALMALFGDDPVLMPQGQPAVLGREAIGSMYRALFRAFEVQVGGEVLEVEVAGDLAYIWSTYSLKATPKARGEPLEDVGMSVFLLKRQEGGWRIARLIANSDLPPTEGG